LGLLTAVALTIEFTAVTFGAFANRTLVLTMFGVFAAAHLP